MEDAIMNFYENEENPNYYLDTFDIEKFFNILEKNGDNNSIAINLNSFENRPSIKV